MTKIETLIAGRDWKFELITKDVAHGLVWSFKYEAEERLPHVAGTAEAIRCQAIMNVCDEILELIPGAKTAATKENEMSEKIVAKLRSGFITDACGIPLRGSTEKIMDEAADLLEQQAKELAEAQERVVVLTDAIRNRDFYTHQDAEWQRKLLATTDTDIVQQVREKHFEECAVICNGLALEYQDDLTDPLLTAMAEGRIYALQQAGILIRAAIGEKK